MANALTDRDVLKYAQMGQISSQASSMVGTPETVVRLSHTKYYTASIPMADSVSLTVPMLESVVAAMPVKGKVTSVSFSTPVSVTANNTNFATWTLSKRTGAGAAVTIATQTTAITGMGSLVLFVPYVAVAADFTAANQQCAAADVLTLSITKTAAGIALTAGTAALLSNVTVTVGVEEN